MATAFKYDPYGHPIEGGSLVGVEEFSLTNSTWVPITGQIKQLVAKTRSGSNFKVSDSVGGSEYITIVGTLTLEVAGSSSTTPIFYAQSVDATDTLEFLFTD